MGNYATLKKRFLALLIDFLTIIGYAIVLLGINMFIYFVILDGIPNFSELGMNLISLILIVPVVVYSIIMESGKRHGTLGKRKLKIKVASSKSQPIRIYQIILRNVIKFLPWQLAHMVIFHGFAVNWQLTPFWMGLLILTDVLPLIWIIFLFRKDHRGIHDLIANTVVVNSVSNN